MISDVFYLLLFCAALSSATGDVTSETPSSTVHQSTLTTIHRSTPTTTHSSGMTLYQDPPTTDPLSCYNFDSLRNINGSCSLRMFCFAFIRRNNGQFRVRRGCSSTCQEERRNRKIKVCCNSHLCNNQFLSPDNFTTVAPCDLTTGSCDGMITTSFNPMSEVATSEATASNIKPPIIIPETSSDIPISEVSPTTGDSYLTCNCNQCEGRGECVGRKCGTSFRMSSSGEPIYDNFCVNETTRCSNLRTPITCCDVTKCNGNIQRGTTTTGSSHITRTHLNTDYHRTGSTGATTASLLSTMAAGSPTGQQYFTMAIVLPVVGGVIVISITLVIIILMITHHKRSQIKLKHSTETPTTTNKTNGTEMKNSPSPSCSMASTSDSNSSSNSSAKTDLLKHLGTSV